MINTSNDWKIKLADAILGGRENAREVGTLKTSKMPNKLYRYRPLKCDESLKKVKTICPCEHIMQIIIMEFAWNTQKNT